jgi:16S rRNA (guanine966-N2)-methyltransferase
VRIVAGTARGIRLGPVPRGVRPLADRAREGVFSSLAADVDGADALDLFAGTGAMGIEALSRGAATCSFVDRSPGAIVAVRGNLERTGLGERGTVIRSEASRFLARAREADARFDLCFLDPPYATPPDRLEGLLTALSDGLLSSGTGTWAVVLTRSKRSFMPVIPVDWRVARRLEYGDGLAIIYREV